MKVNVGVRQDRVAGRRMRWREAGEGDAVVFVHGFPFDASMWDDALARLPTGWRGLAPDLAGFGGSEAPAGPLEMGGFAADVVALMDRLGIERAAVVGLSMGGYVAFALWRAHRERVRGLGLIDTRATADTDEARRGRLASANQVRTGGTRALVDTMLPKLLSPANAEARPDVVERVRAMMEAVPARTVARALEGMAARPDSTALLAEIDVPCLVVTGADDAVTPPADGEAMAVALRDATFELVPAAGHLTPLEAPDGFASALARYLERLGT